MPLLGASSIDIASSLLISLIARVAVHPHETESWPELNSPWKIDDDSSAGWRNKHSACHSLVEC
ncbi:hypothetical protein RISK_005818 [Rhodopirellula islandica]|uniref:Uncharacterized protein n=1 Tax=Rhodopirellula islandica TaxID=595434 RepID=A0A0J1B6C9_RHOIS|nr:hypothetical protein RISK_005818 [Rhodopirellula islandica]